MEHPNRRLTFGNLVTLILAISTLLNVILIIVNAMSIIDLKQAHNSLARAYQQHVAPDCDCGGDCAELQIEVVPASRPARERGGSRFNL